MTSAHAVIGIATAASLAAVVIWGITARLFHRPPGRAFERAARIPLVLLVVQIAMGIALVATGERRAALHYVYGVLATAVLAGGIALGRALERDRWVVVAWSAFVAALLVARALMTGFRTH